MTMTATLGYPRIGRQRELKKALEAYWHGQIDAQSLQQTQQAIAAGAWQTQAQAGIDQIGVGDHSLYDWVLDWAVWLGAVPARFRPWQGLDRVMAMARGRDGVPALEMTKWFDTNYHYLVPELTDDWLPADFQEFRERAIAARAVLGEKAVPMVLGPATFWILSRAWVAQETLWEALWPRYVQLFAELQGAGFREVQVHEPALVLNDSMALQDRCTAFYGQDWGLAIHLQTYFDDLGANYGWVTALPVASIGLDFTRGENLRLVQTHGFPTDKALGVGLVDARNVWRCRREPVTALLTALTAATPAPLRFQMSASLQFLPHTTARETRLPEPLRQVLGFADEKLTELVALATDREAYLTDSDRRWSAFAEFSPANPAVAARLQNLKPSDFERSLPYAERLPHQPSLPPLPTTTIGSFPQTAAVRQWRTTWKRGEMATEEYQKAIDAE
ncbi:MAG: 5-methyltetrahydropteroyltriglutamate--homocysteine S-methyltransferase, partial [Pseudanabaenaceae cyanobacterium]